MIVKTDTPEYKKQMEARDHANQIFDEKLIPIMRQIPDEYLKALKVYDRLHNRVVDCAPWRVTIMTAEEMLQEVKHPVVIEYIDSVIAYCNAAIIWWENK